MPHKHVVLTGRRCVQAKIRKIDALLALGQVALASATLEDAQDKDDTFAGSELHAAIAQKVSQAVQQVRGKLSR